MTATRPTPTRTRRAPLAPLRALASLVALAAVLVAMPAVLFLATRTLSSRFPDRDDLTFDALLARPADAGIAYVVALAVGWLAWTILAGSLLWEVPAALRGRTRRAVRGIRWSQHLAAFLLGGLALGVSAGPALAAHSAPVATISAPATPDTAPATPAPARGSAAPAGPTYTVQRGDTLWDIAERTLGDGARWQEIADLNEGRTMTDGRTFSSVDDIDVGWTLRMPPGARTTDTPPDAREHVAPAAPAAIGGATPATVTVRAGDTLSEIAEDVLGDPDWTPLFDANKNRPQPDGGALTDPDEIETGWVLTVPGADTAAPAESAAPPAAPSDGGAPPQDAPSSAPTTGPDTPRDTSGTGPTAPDPTAPPRDVPGTDQGAPAETPGRATPPAEAPATQQPAPPVQAPVEQQPAPSAQLPAGQPAAEAPAVPPAAADTATPRGGGEASPPPAQPVSPPATTDTNANTNIGADSDDSSLVVPIGIGISVLAGAGLLTALGVRRRLQQRQRRAHRRITLPAPEPAAYEQRLRATEQPDRAAFVDLALRTLASELADAGRPLPTFTTGHLTVAGLELRLTSPEPPIAPFNAVDADTTRWFCPTGAPLIPADRAHSLPAPCPALLPVARTSIGEVLLDLESCPVTTLDGTPAEHREILRTLAVALLSGPRGEDLSVTLVGFDEDLTAFETLAGQRIFKAASLSEALSRLGTWDRACGEVLTREYTPSARAARTIGVAPDTWPPEIILSREALGTDTIATLRELEGRERRAAWAVVAPAGSDCDRPGHWYTLPTGTGPTPLAGIDGDATVHRLSGDDLTALTGILEAAADITGHPAPDTDELPGEDTPPHDTNDAGTATPVAAAAPERRVVTITTRTTTGSGAGATRDAAAAIPLLHAPSAPVPTAPPAKPIHSPTIGTPAADHPVPVAPFDTDATAPEESGLNPAKFAHGDDPVGESTTSDENSEPTAEPLRTFLFDPGSEPAPETDPDLGFEAADLDPEPDFEPTGDLFEQEADNTPFESFLAPAPENTPEAESEPEVEAQAAPFRSFLEPTPRPEAESEPAAQPYGRFLEPEPEVSQTPSTPQIPSTTAPPTQGDHSDVSAWLDSLPTPEDEDAAWAQAWEETLAGFGTPDTTTPKPPQSAPTLSGIPATTHTGPEIRVLGPVEIAGVGDPAEASKRARLTELAAYLVLNPGLGHNDVDTAIWPDSTSATNRHTAMSKLRRWLGTNPDGDPYLPLIGDAGYRFAPGVTCDWTRFQRLARKGMRLGPLGGPDLTQALSLVRGRPFGGTSPRRYIWAEYVRQDMISSIVDVAARLGELRLRDGDARGAKLALGKGLEVCPESEMLYRLMFRAAYLSGDAQELEAYAARLNRLLDDMGCDMEDDTIRLLRSLLEARRRDNHTRATG